MSRKLNYFKRDGKTVINKADVVVGTKPEEGIVRAPDLEAIKKYMNGKMDNSLNEAVALLDADGKIIFGADWTNEAELKALLTKGELVNIESLVLGSAAGIIGTLDVAGRITMVGLHLAPDPTGDEIGVIEITFDATGKITGINMFTRYATLKYVNDELAKKQDKLSATQLAVVNANPFLTADKTKLDGIDLTKYYLKTETYTKKETEDYVAAEIAKIPASQEVIETTTRSFSSTSNSGIIISLAGWVPKRITYIGCGKDSASFNASVIWGIKTDTTGFLRDASNNITNIVTLSGDAISLSGSNPATTTGYSVTIEYEKTVGGRN